MTSDQAAHVCLSVEALWITGSLRQAAKNRAVDDADCGVLAHLYRIERFVSDGLGVTDRGTEVPGGGTRRGRLRTHEFCVAIYACCVSRFRMEG